MDSGWAGEPNSMTATGFQVRVGWRIAPTTRIRRLLFNFWMIYWAADSDWDPNSTTTGFRWITDRLTGGLPVGRRTEFDVDWLPSLTVKLGKNPASAAPQNIGSESEYQSRLFQVSTMQGRRLGMYLPRSIVFEPF